MSAFAPLPQPLSARQRISLKWKRYFSEMLQWFVVKPHESMYFFVSFHRKTQKNTMNCTQSKGKSRKQKWNNKSSTFAHSIEIHTKLIRGYNFTPTSRRIATFHLHHSLIFIQSSTIISTWIEKNCEFFVYFEISKFLSPSQLWLVNDCIIVMWQN